MNVRTLSIISLVILSLSSVSLAQQDVNQPAGASAAPTQPPILPTPPTFRGGARRGFGLGAMAAPDDSQTRIFHLQHAQAGDMARVIANIFGGAGISVDERTNSLIVSGETSRLEQISRLIQGLDVVRESDSPRGGPMMCRVYMVEVPSDRPELKPFTMILGLPGSAFVSAQPMMKAIKDLQVDRVVSTPGQVTVIGRAGSNETLSRMVDAIPGTTLMKLDLDPNGQDEAGLAAIQAPPLNGPVAETVRSLLGGNTQTVGYWFGNVSISGMLSAPLNSRWRLNWSTKSEEESELWLSIRVIAVNSGQPEILSNLVEAAVGKPIIIGYSRAVGGATVTGAVVILLEPGARGGSDPARGRMMPSAIGS
jgi:hypothetical protein